MCFFGVTAVVPVLYALANNAGAIAATGTDYSANYRNINILSIPSVSSDFTDTIEGPLLLLYPAAHVASGNIYFAYNLTTLPKYEDLVYFHF